jgi:hypothetical protein
LPLPDRRATLAATKEVREEWMVRGSRIWLVIAALCLPAVPAQAQFNPQRQITVVVPIGAGGGVDATGRLFAEKLAERLKQTVVVENKVFIVPRWRVPRARTIRAGRQTKIISKTTRCRSITRAATRNHCSLLKRSGMSAFLKRFRCWSHNTQ